MDRSALASLLRLLRPCFGQIQCTPRVSVTGQYWQLPRVSEFWILGGSEHSQWLVFVWVFWSFSRGDSAKIFPESAIGSSTGLAAAKILADLSFFI